MISYIEDLLFSPLLLLRSISVLVALIVVLCAYQYRRLSYWTRLNVPQLPATFPFGNFESPINRKTGIAVAFKQFYEEVRRRGWRYGGIVSLTSPNLVIVDPEIIKAILAKDFQHFVDRGFLNNAKADPLTGHLLALEGTKWRNLRMKLTPTFTSGKMRMMFNTVVDCSKPMEKVLDTAASSSEPLEIKNLFARFTVDVIGSCAFGLDCNSFKDDDGEFKRYGMKALRRSTRDTLAFIFLANFPKLGELLGMKTMSRDVENFFLKVVDDTIRLRKDGGFERKDFMQLLMELLKQEEGGKAEGEGGLTKLELAAQAFIFFIAGFETSSSTANFCMLELARNQDVQDKAREEIREVLGRYDGEVTYEAIQEMKYLGQVVDETLRLYPPLSFLNRKCTVDYKIPDSDLEIKKGTRILISTFGLQRDPEYFPDPERFDPDRFSEENRKNIVPYTYMPFGEGPRICIGMRFGLMQTKIGLIALLKDYKYKLNPKTQIPFVLEANTALLSNSGGTWLDVEKV